MTTTSSVLITLLMILTLGLSGCNTLETRQGTPEKPIAQASKADTVSTPVSANSTPNPESITAEEQPAADLTPAVAKPEPGDLWQRVIDNFSLDMRQNKRVTAQVEWYARHKKHLHRLQERARPYLHHIIEEIERRRLPGELALLPAIESAYRPFAYSPGRASGLWQFIASTGRNYGLHQNWWYDGRRDVIAATRAALDHLEELNQKFDGDWELSLAAYNAGAGGISKAMRKNRKRGKETDYWSLDLPRETELYVPRFLALAEVMANPGKYDMERIVIPNEPYFKTVRIDSQLDLALAADLADITIDELYKLNPGFNRWATAPDGPHRLNIPVANAERFDTELAQLAPAQRLKWTRYKISRGDHLGGIAKRYGTTVAVLKQVNNLSSSRITAGKHLLIPVSSDNQSQYAAIINRVNATGASTPSTHVVKRGESLWSIGKRYGVSHTRLAGWNNLSINSTLRPGQKLQLLGSASKQTGVPARISSAQSTRSSLQYRVRKGDSLYSIASRFKVSITDLRRWNSFPGKYLQPGQRIRLFIDPTSQTL